MKIDVLTLFPDMFKSVLGESIIGRAIQNNIVDINYINIRDFSNDKHNRVDDYPFGGGPGMVMKPEPIYRAINSIKTDSSRVIYLSPKGKVFNQSIANEFSSEEHLVFLCGHYEGIDNRIIENYVDDIISVGDYVLTGGEIPAMTVIDAVVRLLPEVLKSDESFMDESHYNGLLEYPQYTRPRDFNGYEVPKVLLSGNHKKIEEWRRYQSIKMTYYNRPDLIEVEDLSEEDNKTLQDIIIGDKNKL
ncbi:tRNA (guanosine(37)-N1)-methyltransferase TrmD [Clostridium sp. D2Q-11]|uniref:tRNA (guanine-N(1)-)-methyltransferase n=1 Tax=Anaeromonas frigoriresistens TaxID=2683708 RepID=A0A942UX88_9FIRM|nr:tRNA (guanosine(37)-N1)-methyltransferase TrmD [Anaeromonas frigoriresistens]MBS4539775.1 tRNA (guanosine(37)-N1)-methyltransferase TrmD [Anaeromonas frigoriresistens]